MTLGDIILVKPGERIAMDGRVIQGTSMVNQTPITGESMPVEKAPGSEAFAGTVNKEGVLEIEVTRLVQDTTLAKIIDMVEETTGLACPLPAFRQYICPILHPGGNRYSSGHSRHSSIETGAALYPQAGKGLNSTGNCLPCALVISTPVLYTKKGPDKNYPSLPIDVFI